MGERGRRGGERMFVTTDGWRHCGKGVRNESSRNSLDPLQHMTALASSCLSEVRTKFLLGFHGGSLKPHHFLSDLCRAELA